MPRVPGEPAFCPHESFRGSGRKADCDAQVPCGVLGTAERWGHTGWWDEPHSEVAQSGALPWQPTSHAETHVGSILFPIDVSRGCDHEVLQAGGAKTRGTSFPIFLQGHNQEAG